MLCLAWCGLYLCMFAPMNIHTVQARVHTAHIQPAHTTYHRQECATHVHMCITQHVHPHCTQEVPQLLLFSTSADGVASKVRDALHEASAAFKVCVLTIIFFTVFFFFGLGVF